MTEKNDPTPSEEIYSEEKATEQDILSSPRHEGMQTRTYPMSVVVAAAAVAGLLGATLGFTASLASMGISHHSKHHYQYWPGSKTESYFPGQSERPGKPGDRMIDRLCMHEGKVSSSCGSKDDPDTPIPTPPWMGMPKSVPPAPQQGPKEPTVSGPPMRNSAADRLAKYITREKSTVNEATKLALEQGLTVRIVSEDGVGGPLTEDYRLDRINFIVENKLVVKAYIG